MNGYYQRNEKELRRLLIVVDFPGLRDGQGVGRREIVVKKQKESTDPECAAYNLQSPYQKFRLKILHS